MVKRSVEQNLRIKNFEARHGNYETNAVVKNQGTTAWTMNSRRMLAVESQRDSFLKEIIAVSVTISISVRKQHSRIRLRALLRGIMKEMHREPEVPVEKVPVEECSDGTARITSKELAPVHSVKNGILQNLVLQVGEWMQIWGEKCSYAHRQVEEQPSKKGSKNNGDKSAVAMLKFTRQLGCIFQDMEPPKSSSILRKSSNIRKPIPDVLNSQKLSYVMRTFETKNPSLGMVCPGEPHQRNPNAPKIWGSVSGGDRVARARCPRSSVEAGQKCVKIKGDKKEQHSSHLRKIGACLHQLLNLREREFVVDSGASMHMISKKKLGWCWNGYLDEIV